MPAMVRGEWALTMLQGQEELAMIMQGQWAALAMVRGKWTLTMLQGPEELEMMVQG